MTLLFLTCILILEICLPHFPNIQQLWHIYNCTTYEKANMITNNPQGQDVLLLKVRPSGEPVPGDASVTSPGSGITLPRYPAWFIPLGTLSSTQKEKKKKTLNVRAAEFGNCITFTFLLTIFSSNF